MTEFTCYCDPPSPPCMGCQANAALKALLAECAQIADRVCDGATCRTVRKTSRAIADRIRELGRKCSPATS